MKSLQKAQSVQLDETMNKLANQLYYKNLLEEKESYNSSKFYQLHEMLEKSFMIPKTSITKVMSRLLFSIGYSKKPKVMVGAGTYTGHALAWLSGFYLLNDAPEDVKIYGLDVSLEATQMAKNNFALLNAGDVVLLETDAIEWIKNTEETVDLLYIDIDTAEDGKKKYVDLLNAAYPKIASEGLILAHDINEEKFINDIQPFVEEVLNQSKYRSSVNLNVDAYGLSISIKGDNDGGS